MIKHLPLLLFIGLAWGQEDLVIKKAKRYLFHIINFYLNLFNLYLI